MTNDLNAFDLCPDLAKKLSRGMLTQPSDIDPDFEMIKQLGWGYEGYVYLVRERSTGRKLVLKIYHDPFDHEKGIWDGLQSYADCVQDNPFGLFKIKARHESKQIVAVQYPYKKLYSLHYRLIKMSSQVGRSLLGQFCMMQSYLLSEYGIGIIDPVPSNFLMDKGGQFHFIDFGLGIRKINDPLAVDYGLFGYGFAALLLGIHHINLREQMEACGSYDYNQPCIYNLCEKMEKVSLRISWVRSILEQICSQKASIFHDPCFYQEIGKNLPQRVDYPLTVTAASFLVRLLKSSSKVRQQSRVVAT